MSKFLKIFKFSRKNKKDAAVLPAPTAIQKLREMEELLGKKQQFFENKIEAEVTCIKQNVRTNKRVAIQALKRKKRFEKLLQQIDGTLTTIEMQRETLEGANANTEVFKSMSQAAKTLKAVHTKMDVDKIHEMMDDIADQQEIAKEISDAVSNPIAFGQDVDDDELEKELEAMEQEDLDTLLLSVSKPNDELAKEVNPDSGPSVSGLKVIAKEAVSYKTDEEECKELIKWAEN